MKTHHLMATIGMAVALLFASTAFAQEKISHGRFTEVSLYRPHGEVKSVALFLSGGDGGNGAVSDMAQALVDQGALVVGINVPQLVKTMEADAANCAYPAGDLENLSRFAQAYAHLPTYKIPLLVGDASGAALAYATAAQAPKGTFLGALSLGFCPEMAMTKVMCKGEGLQSTARKDGNSTDLAPFTTRPLPWIALQRAQDQACPVKDVQNFVAQVPGATVVLPPKVAHGPSTTTDWRPQYTAAYRSLTARSATTVPLAAPRDLRDLPVVEVLAGQGTETLAPTSPGHQDMFAVLLSGDGGWAGLDKDLAAALKAKGISVVGLDSLRYFWSKRTPEGLAGDLDRIVRHYATHWHKSQVVLIGYSQGADVLPFAVNRLSPDTRALVTQTVLISPTEKADFEFHLGSWIGQRSGEYLTRPEVDKFQSENSLCLYGEEETNSLCPKLSGKTMTVRALPGGHHYGGSYEQLSTLILEQVQAK